MELQTPVETVEKTVFTSLDFSPERIESEALKRILAEVVDGRDETAMAIGGYDRVYNRHNR